MGTFAHWIRLWATTDGSEALDSLVDGAPRPAGQPRPFSRPPRSSGSSSVSSSPRGTRSSTRVPGSSGRALIGLAVALTLIPLVWLTVFGRHRRIAYRGDWLRAIRRVGLGRPRRDGAGRPPAAGPARAADRAVHRSRSSWSPRRPSPRNADATAAAPRYGWRGPPGPASDPRSPSAPLTATPPAEPHADDKARLAAAVEAARDEILDLSHRIHADPEPAFEEHHAAAWVGEILAPSRLRCGAPGGQPRHGDPRRRRGGHGGDGPRIGILAEYDALPGLGHGCGHNTMAASGVGAAIALAAIADELPGEIVFLGTPAEERGSGKQIMIDDGLFEGIDAALMYHPCDRSTSRRYPLASEDVDVVFTGLQSHASSDPWRGKNALDALIRRSRPPMRAGSTRRRSSICLPPAGAAGGGGDRPRLRVVQLARADRLRLHDPLPGVPQADVGGGDQGQQLDAVPLPEQGDQALQQVGGPAAQKGGDDGGFLLGGHRGMEEQRPELRVLDVEPADVVEILAQAGVALFQGHVEERPRVPASGPFAALHRHLGARLAHGRDGMGLRPGLVVKRASVLCFWAPIWSLDPGKTSQIITSP